MAQRLTYQTITIDTVYVHLPNTSFEGFWGMDNQQLLFFDKPYSSVSVFDNSGKYLSTPLKKGQGPLQLDSWCKNGSEHLIFGGFDIYRYNSNWKKISHSRLNFKPTISKKEILENPKAEYLEIYEVKYFHNKLTMLDSTHVLYNIETTHPKFNGYFSNVSNEYFQRANIFGRINIDTGRWEENLLNYSNYYVQHPNLINFSNWSYDIDSQHLYLNFEADSLIYVYDKQFKPLYSFGSKGINMNQKYIETTTLKESNRVVFQERVRKGFYSDITRIEAVDLTFRCYTTGNSQTDVFDNDYSNNRRMQIYKKTELVADIKVPNRFKIIGYDDSFIYADGIIETSSEKIAFFKFKIPTL